MNLHERKALELKVESFLRANGLIFDKLKTDGLYNYDIDVEDSLGGAIIVVLNF